MALVGKYYELLYVELRAKQLRCLGRQVDSRVRQDLHTRIVMLGRGWDVDRLAQSTGMQV